MTEEIESMISRINGWDKESIFELREMLNEFPVLIRDARAEGEITDAEAEFYKGRIDITDLPSVAIPEDIDTGYPVWAMDKEERCLTGEDMQSITSLTDIREHQAERRKSLPHTISLTGYEMIEKVVKARGSSGGVYVPPDWIGHSVAVIRFD